jgi:hypothetical protein
MDATQTRPYDAALDAACGQSTERVPSLPTIEKVKRETHVRLRDNE